MKIIGTTQKHRGKVLGIPELKIFVRTDHISQNPKHEEFPGEISKPNADKFQICQMIDISLEQKYCQD